MSFHITSPTGEIVPVRPAATVMVVRDAEPADSGVEVFVLRRTTVAAFGAGMYVFPGGRVDDADGGADIESFVADLDDERASAALGVERGGLAYWVAAIRECFEEAGLLLAHPRTGGTPHIDPNDRHAVHCGDMSIIDVCRRHDLVLDAGALRYVAHWITPVGESRRFDTRFFVAEAPHGQDGVHDETETIDSRWIRPADALRDAERGDLLLMPPTVANIEFLVDCASAADAIAKADAAGPPSCIEPRLRVTAEGRVVGVALPHDPDYLDLA